MIFTKLLMSVQRYITAYGYPLILKKIKSDNSLYNFRIFGNSKQDELPDGYTQLEYIEATGTQFIDTNISNGKFVHDIEFTSTDRNLMGFSTTAGTFWGSEQNAQAYELGTESIDLNTQERRIITYNTLNGQFSLEADGESVSYNKSSIVNTYSLFHIKDSQYCSKAKLYSLNVYDSNGNLIQNLIPAKRDFDSNIGLYDIVSHNFFENQGTGNFVAGGNIEPSTDNPISIQSVGIQTKNLFDKDKPFTLNSFLNPDGSISQNNFWNITDFIPVSGYDFVLTRANQIGMAPCIIGYDKNKNKIASTQYDNANKIIKLHSDQEIKYIRFSINKSNEDINIIQLEKGITATDYERYGYRIDITATNESNTKTQKAIVYLDQPLRKVDDYADFIDFFEQKVTRNIEVIDDTGTKPINDSLRILANPIKEDIEISNLPAFKGSTIYTINGLSPSNMYGQVKQY